MDRGYVKLWRKTLDGKMYRNQPLWTFWTWCLMKASYRAHTQQVGFQQVQLEPGQFIFGRKSASVDLDMSERTIRTCLQHLETMQNLTIKTTNKFSIITITNWDTYQSREDINDQQSDQHPTSKRPASDHKQEGKEKKEGKEQKTSSSKAELSDAALPLAILLRDLINARSNGTPIVPEKTNMQTWAKEIDRMIRLDKRTPEDIEAVIRFSQRDKFWQSNILSTGKLREKFPQLFLKMDAETPKTSQQIEYPKGMKAL